MVSKNEPSTTQDPGASLPISRPPPEALHVEWVIDALTGLKVVGMVRHAAPPYEDKRPTDVAQDAWVDFCRLGHAYLLYLTKVLSATVEPSQWLHPRSLQALDPDAGEGSWHAAGFGWLPIQPSSSQKSRGPLSSYWAERRVGGEGSLPTERSLVLLAGNLEPKHMLQLGSDIGLRIVMHVHAEGRVRIHGVTISGLSDLRAVDVVPFSGQAEKIYGCIKSLRPAVERALGHVGKVWFSNLELMAQGTSTQLLRASGVIVKESVAPDLSDLPDGLAAKRSALTRNPGASRNSLRDFCVDTVPADADGNASVVRVLRNQYVGGSARATAKSRDADVRVRAFLDTPIARAQSPSATTAPSANPQRPTIDQRVLADLREDVELQVGQRGVLRYDEAEPWFESRGPRSDPKRAERHTVHQVKEDGVVRLSLDEDPSPRSDQQGCIDAFVRAAELFGRFMAYGIDPTAYFRFASLPLVQRVRPSMIWAPDGELPNAEVRPFLADGDGNDDTVSRWANGGLRLLVKYGSADPWHRQRIPLVDEGTDDQGMDGRKKAQYLSLASDPRWAWHEFGHVLNFASTGEFEFPFAHSAGDALAAIATDPLSPLASSVDPEAPARFVTYPWIQIPGRSHGRSARLGYCWCGIRNAARLDFTSRQERFHHGYFGEQLLSSSLFRLYRCLGGDTRGDLAKESAAERESDRCTRLSASEYCIYLIIRAVSMLGPDSIAPARTPDQFVSALIEADLGTGQWNIDASWPLNQDPVSIERHGGRVHKVIRWAFERQGLFATDDPQAIVEGPGMPPMVDLYIPDRRQEWARLAAPGSYESVPLRFGQEEPWHADRSGIDRVGSTVTVRFGDRGSQRDTAGSVGLDSGTVRLFSSPDQGYWKEVGPGSPVQDANPNGLRSWTFSLAGTAVAESLWLLAIVDSPVDPSNLVIDPSNLTMDPSSRVDDRSNQVIHPDEFPPSERGLLDLVSSDNNLALAWRVP